MPTRNVVLTDHQRLWLSGLSGLAGTRMQAKFCARDYALWRRAKPKKRRALEHYVTRPASGSMRLTRGDFEASTRTKHWNCIFAR